MRPFLFAAYSIAASGSCGFVSSLLRRPFPRQADDLFAERCSGSCRPSARSARSASCRRAPRAGARGGGDRADRQGRGAAHRRVGGVPPPRRGAALPRSTTTAARDGDARHPARDAARGGADRRALARRCFSDARLGREIHNQVLAYAHAASNFGGAFRWMAFIDADEFLVPKQAASIPEALAHLGEARNVSLPWHMFGRSGHARAAGGRRAAQLPAAGARPDERRARGARVQGASSIPAT